MTERRRIGQTLNDNLGTAQPPRISILDNRFTMIDATGATKPVETFDPKTGPYVDCVMLDALEVRSKIFWGEGQAYDPTNKRRPVCHSNNGVSPSINAQEPQARFCSPGDPPNNCQWAVWGSATSQLSGKGIPACQDHQNVAVMIPGQEVVFLFRIPPNSFKNLSNYNGKFSGQDFEVDDVITRINFEPGKRGTLAFAPVRPATDEEKRRRDSILDSGITDNLVGRGDRPYEGPIALEQGVPVKQIVSGSEQQPYQPSAPPHTQQQPMFPPEQKAQPAPQQAKRGPGRPPKKLETGTAQADPPWQGNGGSQGQGFGIQEPTQPDPGVAKVVSDFFGKNQ